MASPLLATLRDPRRGFSAVVVGEPHRAFYGNQFGGTAVHPLRRRTVGARNRRSDRPDREIPYIQVESLRQVQQPTNPYGGRPAHGPGGR